MGRLLQELLYTHDRRIGNGASLRQPSIRQFYYVDKESVLSAWRFCRTGLGAGEELCQVGFIDSNDETMGRNVGFQMKVALQ
jgi:hypothetical protein